MITVLDDAWAEIFQVTMQMMKVCFILDLQIFSRNVFNGWSGKTDSFRKCLQNLAKILFFGIDLEPDSYVNTAISIVRILKM